MIGFDGVTFRTERVERTVEFEQLYSLSCDIVSTMGHASEQNLAGHFLTVVYVEPDSGYSGEKCRPPVLGLPAKFF